MSRHIDERTRALQAQSTAIVLRNHEDPKQDIANERRRATFDTNDLLYFLNGGKEKVERRCVHGRAWHEGAGGMQWG